MTAGGFEVDSDDLVAHASHVDGLVDRLNTAVSASDSAMSDHAYGLLCAFLPPIIRPTGEQAQDTLKASIEGVTGLSDNVRTAAQSYRDGEEGNAQPFERQLAASPREAEAKVKA
ncbi:type VII secretion target [Amycolatopsis sp., V23-08]|uniref:Type VII secretion target n=1 Tax=Amycolatopsis heterodermiae TaxID=3110235 RepID=A0ABU5RFP5_9PSEU|nr:type VII secretion target [Amycolatopsis sp., V23-08]MEA5365096.1 type VII secretion target [Amycolatopsis sp., V23-08]